MPINKHIDQSKQLTTFVLENGKTSFEEVLAAVKGLYKGNPTKNVLWDAAEGSVADLTKEHVEKLASLSPRFSDLRSGGKTALYSPGDMAFGLMRMFEIISNLKNIPIQIRVFRNKDEAIEWLDKN